MKKSKRQHVVRVTDNDGVVEIPKNKIRFQNVQLKEGAGVLLDVKSDPKCIGPQLQILLWDPDKVPGGFANEYIRVNLEGGPIYNQFPHNLLVPIRDIGYETVEQLLTKCLAPMIKEIVIEYWPDGLHFSIVFTDRRFKAGKYVVRNSPLFRAIKKIATLDGNG